MVTSNGIDLMALYPGQRIVEKYQRDQHHVEITTTPAKNSLGDVSFIGKIVSTTTYTEPDTLVQYSFINIPNFKANPYIELYHG